MSEIIARQIVDFILVNQLTEGSPLPTEREMVVSLGAGRSTVREALRLLETRGVIAIRQGANGGPVVRGPRPRDLAEMLSLVLSFSRASLRDLFAARLAIEPVVVEMAAARVSAGAAAELAAGVDRMAADVSDQAALAAEIAEVQAALIRFAGNPALGAFAESVRDLFAGLVSGVPESVTWRESVVQAYRRVVAALAAGDGPGAAAEMRRHLEEEAAHGQRRYGVLWDRPVSWTL